MDHETVSFVLLFVFMAVNVVQFIVGRVQAADISRLHKQYRDLFARDSNLADAWNTIERRTRELEDKAQYQGLELEHLMSTHKAVLRKALNTIKKATDGTVQEKQLRSLKKEIQDALDELDDR